MPIIFEEYEPLSPTRIDIKYISYKTKQPPEYKGPKFDDEKFIEELHRCVDDEVFRDIIKTNNRYKIDFSITMPKVTVEENGEIKKKRKLVKLYNDLQRAIVDEVLYTFSDFANEDVTCWGYTFDKSPALVFKKEDEKIIANLSLEFEYSGKNIKELLTLMSSVLLYPDNIHIAPEISCELSISGGTIGTFNLSKEPKPLEFSIDSVKALYSDPFWSKLLFSQIRNRDVLYNRLIEKESGDSEEEQFYIKPGMRYPVKENDSDQKENSKVPWRKVIPRKPSDVAKFVDSTGIVDIVPSINRIGDVHGSVLFFDWDIGPLVTPIIDTEKAEKLKAYLLKKTCNLLDQYGIDYVAKFSGKKGYHVLAPVDFREPPVEHQEVLKLIAINTGSYGPKDLPDLEKEKSFKDSYEFYQRFIEIFTARLAYFEMGGVTEFLDLNDFRNLGIEVKHFAYDPQQKKKLISPEYIRHGEDIYWINLSQLISAVPAVKRSRTRKILCDPSVTHREAKWHALGAIKSNSGLVSVPIPFTWEEGEIPVFDRVRGRYRKFDERFFDPEFLKTVAKPDNVLKGIQSHGKEESTIDWTSVLEKYGITNENIAFLDKPWNTTQIPGKGVRAFVDDHRGYDGYIHRNGVEALFTQVTPAKARWVRKSLWDKEVEGYEKQINYYRKKQAQKAELEEKNIATPTPCTVTPKEEPPDWGYAFSKATKQQIRQVFGIYRDMHDNLRDIIDRWVGKLKTTRNGSDEEKRTQDQYPTLIKIVNIAPPIDLKWEPEPNEIPELFEGACRVLYTFGKQEWNIEKLDEFSQQIRGVLSKLEGCRFEN